MAIMSRGAPRSNGGQFAKSRKEVASVAMLDPSNHINNNAPTFDRITPDDSQRPAKRLKLTIKGPRQQPARRSSVVSRSGRPKPPTKVSVAQPNGQLIETTNGVQSTLNITQNDLTPLPSGATTPNAASQKHSHAVPHERKEDKRTLRSQDDGPRLKSDLSVYFTNYEDLIFDAPKEPEFLTTDTAIFVTDDAVKHNAPNASAASRSPKAERRPSGRSRQPSTNGFANSSLGSNGFNGSHVADFSILEKGIPVDDNEDPLSDAHFFKAHRRAERKEKQLRNIERERAMHEKVQLERILDGLKGHDWLRVLGLTGITDGEAKKYESKRDFFIEEVQALVTKFKEWKEEEKRVRMEKEAAARAAEEEAVEDEEVETEGSEPPTSELNASAARQLQREVASSIKVANKMKDRAMMNAPIPYRPPSPERPFTSFYDKLLHLRDAALGKSRHGRNVTAFGCAVPEFDDREFTLPEDYVSPDMLRANARERRRKKRASVADAAG